MVCNLMLAGPEGEAEGPRRVTTTLPKAKEARRLAERIITLGKRGTLHARRRALALLQNKAVVKLVFEEIAPLYSDRNGGYTRILRLPKCRLGDGADLCYFELVAEAVEVASKVEEPVAPRVAAGEAPPTGAPDDSKDEAPADESEQADEEPEADEPEDQPAQDDEE